jgi:VIT1/CCC1 family predicted Fe2+/Mn2+ transporter
MDLQEKERILNSVQDELDGVYLYQTLAQAEKDERIAEVYRRMAASEQRHANIWIEQLKNTGQSIPTYRPSWRTTMLALLARRFGASLVLPSIMGMEQSGVQKYRQIGHATDTAADESSHARLLGAINGAAPGGMQGGTLAQLEGRHRAMGGNALRAAVLGANDGLVSNLSLVMGVAGADMSTHAILITGLAGLLAGACSMALGEWLSVQSSRELYQHQVAVEAAELEHAPQDEANELALIYQARGIAEDKAQQMADQIIANRSIALETLAREELNVDPQELGGSAWEAAITSFFLFALGAIIPVIPFIFLNGIHAISVSILISTLGLFLIGAGTSLFTGRSVWFSGMRMVIFGLAAAAVTFLIGRLIGVNLAG